MAKLLLEWETTKPTTAPYNTLLRQTQILQKAGIHLALDGINMTAKVPSEIESPIRPKLLAPLAPLGVTGYTDLLDHTGRHIINTTDLALKYNQVTTYMKITLNKITSRICTSKASPPQMGPPCYLQTGCYPCLYKNPVP